jgi:predicted dienelactone hydrolase
VRLGYPTASDVPLRVREACGDFGDELTDLVYADALGSPGGALLRCQREVANRTARLGATTLSLWKDCNQTAYRGGTCQRARRDARIAEIRARVATRIQKRCGALYARLGLGPLDALLETIVVRGRHYAQRVYPPNDLGPTADFGPYPVGIRTLALVDPSRSNAQGTGPRPVTTEVYYPSTAAATAGVPRDVAEVLGIPVVETPAYRDVARAPGRFPLIVFSHGNGGIRIQSFFFAAHLASHGYVVVSPDHHGNTFTDALLGIVDPDVVDNRPRDMSFLIDRFLAFDADPQSPFAGAIDGTRIGASGHSFGGLTAFRLAGPDPLRDPRVKAILPQAPGSPFPPDFFAGITVPVLIVGGSIDETTPFESQQQLPWELLPSGASVVALAEIRNAGHFTFSDYCEPPRELLAFLGGFSEACEPRHIPWRHAHDIVNYLGLNFFDATLRGDAAALGRLDPAVVAAIEDVTYQTK